MKKKLLMGFAVLGIAVVTALNVSFSVKGNGLLSDVFLTNVEALARVEDPLPDQQKAKASETTYEYDDQGRLISSKTIEWDCCIDGSSWCYDVRC